MIVRWLLCVLGFVFRCLPRRAANAVGAVLGYAWYYLIPVRRSVAKANLELAFADKDKRERRKIARASFVHLGRCAVEFLRLGGLTVKKVNELFEHVGWQHYEQAMQKGRGVIVVTAHFGNFDLLACAEALSGVPLHIVTREQHVGSINSYWMSQRARFGLGLLPVKNSAFRILKLLRAKQAVALVIDQHMPPGRGIAVPFFSRPASTTHAPAILALSTGAPILPVTIERLSGGRHKVTIDSEVEINQANDRQAEVERVTIELNRWLEDKICERPDQWLWIHRRWKLQKNLVPGADEGQSE